MPLGPKTYCTNVSRDLCLRFCSSLSSNSKLVFSRKTVGKWRVACSFNFLIDLLQLGMGGSGGAMVLGKLPVPGRPTILGGGRVVRWSWVNFQCRGVLHFG